MLLDETGREGVGEVGRAFGSAVMGFLWDPLGELGDGGEALGDFAPLCCSATAGAGAGAGDAGCFRNTEVNIESGICARK